MQMELERTQNDNRQLLMQTLRQSNARSTEAKEVVGIGLGHLVGR